MKQHRNTQAHMCTNVGTSLAACSVSTAGPAVLFARSTPPYTLHQSRAPRFPFVLARGLERIYLPPAFRDHPLALLAPPPRKVRAQLEIRLRLGVPPNLAHIGKGYDPFQFASRRV